MAVVKGSAFTFPNLKIKTNLKDQEFGEEGVGNKRGFFKKYKFRMGINF